MGAGLPRIERKILSCKVNRKLVLDFPINASSIEIESPGEINVKTKKGKLEITPKKSGKFELEIRYQLPFAPYQMEGPLYNALEIELNVK